MAENITYKRKLNEDGTPYLDENGDFVNEVVSVEVIDDEPIVNAKEKLEKDKQFGKSLIDLFLLENRESNLVFTPMININLLQKFENVQKLADVGDIKTVKFLLENVEIDEIFTQERKNNYVQLCSNYLGL